MDNLLLKIIRTLALSLPLAFPVTALGSDLQILVSDATTFQFIVNVDGANLEHRPDADSLPTFFTTVQVGLPAGARAELVSARGLSTSGFDTDRAGVSALSAVSHPLAEVADPITIRGRRIAAVRVYPVTGGTMYDRVEVTVRFIGGRTAGVAAVSDPHFDRIFRTTIANYEQFVTWPQEERPAARLSQTVGPFAGAQDWYKIAVDRTGLCRVTGSQLAAAGLSLSGLNSNTNDLYNAGG